MAFNLSSSASSSWLYSLLALIIMRLCMSISFSAICDIRITDYTKDPETGTCQFQGDSDGDPYVYKIPIYFVEFFLPVLGGLSADKWFGELRLLRISSFLILLSTVYFAAVDFAGVICIPSVYLVGLLPGCLANGIGAASLLAAPLKIAHGQSGSPTPGLIAYYTFSAFGQLIGLLPRLIRPLFNLTWTLCIPPLVYIVASALLRLDWSSFECRAQYRWTDGFHFPTKARLLRYFLLLAPLVMLVNLIASVRGAYYCYEINFYLNRTSGNSTRDTCSEVFTGYNLATMATMLLLAGCYRIGCLDNKDGRISARFYSGSALMLLGRVAMIGWNSWAGSRGLELPDPLLTHTVYASASAVDGVSNALALASGYELMYRVAPAGHKNLVMGLLFTVWAIGTGIAGMIFLLMINFPRSQPVFKPSHSKSNNIYIVYVVMTIEVAMMIVYYGCVNAKLAGPMMELDDVGDENAGGDGHGDDLSDAVRGDGMAEGCTEPLIR